MYVYGNTDFSGQVCISRPQEKKKKAEIPFTELIVPFGWRSRLINKEKREISIYYLECVHKQSQFMDNVDTVNYCINGYLREVDSEHKRHGEYSK